MRCHYVKDDDGQKVLIPFCMSVVQSNDIRDCRCYREIRKQKRLENQMDAIEDIAVKHGLVSIVRLIRDVRDEVERLIELERKTP